MALKFMCKQTTPPEKETLKNGKERLTIPKVNEQSILFLEDEIDKMDKNLPQMTHFILPGGHQTVSFCHLARCVCRRAERLIVELKDKLLKAGISETQTILVSGDGGSEGFRQEALTALMALGIAKPAAQKAMNRAIRNSTKSINSVEDLIREALKAM